MKAKSIIVVILLLMTPATYGQTVIGGRMSIGEVSQLLKTLNGIMADTTRIDILLKLAEHNLQKEDGKKSNLDSATMFIRNAKEINTKQISRKRDGRVLLDESTLARKNGDIKTGMQLVNRAIGQLQSTDDEFHLVLAYMEHSRYYDSGQPSQEATIKDIFNRLFQLVRKMADDRQFRSRPFVLRNFYHLEMKQDSYPTRLYFLNKLVVVDSMLSDKENQFWARKETADIHSQQGKGDMAANELLQIAKEQKATGGHQLCFTYDLLAGVYLGIANFDKALYYSLETIKNVRTAFDSAYLPGFYERTADCYSVTENWAESVEWDTKSLNLLIERKTTDNIYKVLLSLVQSMILLDKPREVLNLLLEKSKIYVPRTNVEKRNLLLGLGCCYAALNNNAMAEKYFGELTTLNELRIKQKEITADVRADQYIGEYYYDNEQYSKAEKYFRRVKDEWTEDRNTGIYYTSYFLFRIDSAKGDYLAAIKDLQDYDEVHDSIHAATKLKQIEELKVSYATEQKDQLIKLKEQNIQLLTKQDLLQKSKLQQGAVLRNISFAVVALLIIIMALLYNRYRVKQRTNTKLEFQQREIIKQVNEKDWLLKEIHHRVKNNLQIIMSLLNSQSAYIDNEPALTAIHDSQHRVHAMALIHQKLYNTENVSSIDMSLYIRELVSYLSDSFNTGQRIRFELTIEALQMDVSQAVPLGLILNEAITNSIKYAFPDDRKGVISISFSNTAPHHYSLSIADNGIGIPVHVTNKKTGSLGMSLMAGLSEDLDGTFSLENNNGTTIRISFVHDLGVKRSDISTTSYVSNN